MVSSTPRPHFTPGKDPVPIVQETGWAPGPVWTGGKSRPHRDSIPDLPAPSQSLYRLSYPTHNTYMYFCKIILKVTLKLFPWLIKPHKKMYDERRYSSTHSDAFNKRNFTLSRFPPVHIWVGDWVNSITPVTNRNSIPLLSSL